MRYSLSLMALLALAACTLTSPKNVGKGNMFGLPSVTQAFAKKNRGSIEVNYPAAPAELDTYRIALLLDNNKRDYIAGSRWGEFLPSVVQASFIDSLKNSGGFSKVTSDQHIGDSRYRLDMEILHFSATYTSNEPATAIVEITFALKKVSNMHTVTEFTERATVAASGKTAASLAQAFSDAYAQVQREALKKIAAKL